MAERTQELRFFDNDESKVAKWSDLKKLNSLETHTVKLFNILYSILTSRFILVIVLRKMLYVAVTLEEYLSSC